MSLAVTILIRERNELVELLAEGDKAYIELYHASKAYGKRVNLGKLLREKHVLQEPLMKAIYEIDEALMVLEPEEEPLAKWEKELLGIS